MRPLDPQEFATEPSPIAHVTLRDYSDQVTATVQRLAERMPHRQIVLLGHSMAGLVLNQVGEAIPELIGRLVYLSAWMTADGTSFSDYMFAPEFSTGLIPSILLADPTVTGVLRMDFRSSDPEYRARVKAAFAADVDDHDWDAITNLLTPDTPTDVQTLPTSHSPFASQPEQLAKTLLQL
jgi:pimeloyl-ACP methyl ester carboxylesterase